MAKTKAERLASVHERALRRFDKIQTAVRDERLQCVQDRRFYSVTGAQWEGPLGQMFENKPRLEVNKIHLAIIRIFNDYRNNRIDLRFVSKEGEEYDDLADTCASLYRADEQNSTAEEAYDNAFEEGVGGGFGAWRLRVDYQDEDSDDDDRKCIKIEPIFDADSSVYFDLDAKRYDKADAKYCYVLTSITLDAYRDEYGDNPESWSKVIFQRQFDWLTPDVVYLAEYYEVEQGKEIFVTFTGATGETREYVLSQLDQDELDELAATGFQETGREIKRRKRIHKYLISGNRVIEDQGYIAGRYIPIVPYYGKRWFVDNVERCMGHVRLAKDPQRIKNMQLSKLAEISAVSSVEKPIFTPEQISGHQVMWAEDNIKNFPYLMANQLTGPDGNPVAIGPQAYTRSPQIPPALAGLLQLTEQDMRDVLGNQQAGDQIVSNISGKAVELVQQRLDMQSYIYVSNFSKSIKRSGQIWLSMARDVFVEDGRKMKGISESGDMTQIELRRPVTGESGEIEYENDLSEADFDIAVTVGPSSDSKRQATVRSLVNLMGVTQDPETQQVLSAMIMLNTEGEGVKDVRKYFRKKLVNMGVVKPTDEEMQEMQQAQQAAANQPPDAQTLYLQAAAQQASADAQEAAAGAQKRQAETLLTMAKVDESRANALKTLGEAQAGNAVQNMDYLMRFPDWHEAMAQSQSMISQEMADAIKSAPDAHALAYALAKRPDLADQISRLPAGSQGEAVMQLSDQIGSNNG